MTVETQRQGERRPSAGGALSGWLAGLLRARLGARGVGIATLLAALAIWLYFRRYEGGWPNQFFVITVTALIATAIVLLTRRLLVAAVLVPAMIAIVVMAAAAKHKAMDMSIHAYDLVFYLTSTATLNFLWSDYRGQLLELIAALAAMFAAAVLAYRFDGTRVPRLASFIALCGLAGLTAVAANVKGERRHTQQYWEDLVVSTFYSSWSETVETLWRGQLIEAAGTANGPVFTVPATCTTAEKPPHIILVHEESVVPPSLVPTVQYDTSLDSFFGSFDGNMHKMRVETYGGASWLTEFSILAGVSTYSFGGMRPFVQSLMAGKVHDTLPEALARCGYRNVVFYPLSRNFVSNAKFYTAAGMPEIRDMQDQGATRHDERDRFYFSNALALMEEHFKQSRQPLFTFILTMATHAPYEKAYMPEVDVPGGGPGTDPEMNEYLRRLAMARMDYDYFVKELERHFPGERFLVMHYGDHHPIATRSYLGFANAKAAEDVSLAPDSPGFTTYFAVNAIRYAPPALPDVETLDVPYLGTVLLEAAGLPLSDAYTERKRLLTMCKGRYYGCPAQDQILAFHRRLMDSGLVDAR